METLEDHVAELRNRLKRIAIILVLASAATFYFSQPVLGWLQTDLRVSLNALRPYEAFYTQLMISILGGVLISLPYTIFEMLRFMKPGLKNHEYKVLRNYLPFSIILFVGGAVFAYNYIVKLSLEFFQGTTTESQVAAVWGLQNTLGFAMKLSAFTGIIFQLPIVSLILAEAGLIDKQMMNEYRSYFIIAILIAAAVATPPDIFTQLLVTLPVIGLYQLSIFLVGRVET